MNDRSRPPDDAGFTLIEVMVSSALLATVLALFTAGMTEMFQAAGSVQALDQVQAGFRIAVLQINKEIRFAAAIGTPVQVAADSGNWHVVLATPTADCIELRLNTTAGTLDRRNVTAGESWKPLISSVLPDGTTAPFTRVDGGSSGHQSLTLDVTLTAGGTRDATQRTQSVDFTAVNSTVDSEVPAGCGVAP